ncbi:Uncharacterised protein [Moraxella lacunata]|uniref:Uncharacterized protein n=1 Tax=Moraxella lacunata TaxID=477 RepID=A0A378TUW5_MORLA|nr:hypothetical protein [Moraxella lacunata]STZ63780.1 Uncharacterised protein [Moraxella lacunata]
MANLQETPTWEAGIYQLETSDPVMGGENGIDNRAPRQLANRTLWLKNELARQIGAVNSGKLGKTENAVSATKLATARNIAMTGDGSWSVNFDGSQNATGAMTLANTGVTAGSYNSVTVDAKGRVTAGLTQTHGLVTATTAQGTANTATTNGNTFLNIVASGVGQTASVGSSTQITGTNGITVSSDTAGKLIVARDSNSPTATKLQTPRTINGVAFDGTQNIAITDNTKAPADHRHNWNEIDGKPSAFTPSSHTHAWSQITGVPSASTTTQGIVQLNDTLTSTATNQALTANQGKVLKSELDEKVRVSTLARGTDVRTIKDDGVYALAGGGVNLPDTRAYKLFSMGGSSKTWVHQLAICAYSTEMWLSSQVSAGSEEWLPWVRIDGADWESIRGKPNNLAYTSSNVATATKLATARQIALTGDGTGQANFDGSANASIALTLANSGVTAGSYNSVTVDAKGRVTAGLTQTHGLVTATTAIGTANTATTNTNTFLNIVASGVGSTASVGSSTQITGTNGISVSSDTAGKLIVTRDSNSPTATKLQTARNIALTGAVTGNVNFDGSGNVSMATTLTKATVRDFNRTINGTATALGGTTNTIEMTGQVVVSADGLIRQYFHLKHFRDWWFGRDDNAVGYQNHDIANYKIPIALWTAMPNKVLSVQAQTMRSSDIASSAQFSSEAAEHEVAWAFRNQGIDKSNVWLNLSRMHGGASEHIDLFVIVEGY